MFFVAAVESCMETWFAKRGQRYDSFSAKIAPVNTVISPIALRTEFWLPWVQQG